MPYPVIEFITDSLRRDDYPNRLVGCDVHSRFPCCAPTVQSLNGRPASEVPKDAVAFSLLLSCVTPQRRYTFLHSSHRIGVGGLQVTLSRILGLAG